MCRSERSNFEYTYINTLYIRTDITQVGQRIHPNISMPLNVFYKKGYDTCMYNMLIKETKKKIISIIKRKKKTQNKRQVTSIYFYRFLMRLRIINRYQ